MKQVPYRIRRRVKWGETDPAGIVYTPRFMDYAVEALESWFADIVGVDWYGLRRLHGLGSPLAHASLDFRKPLFPHEEFDVGVLVLEIGRSSITVRIEGRNPAGELCFEGRLVSVIIDAATIRPHAIPPDFRTRIENYARACKD
ncbi:MAG: acyl-CoA thioesterase [Alphaproteobacteria bacterium]|nr:acyl-CoA thioesterase [Alphaproteobacteria bacterium]